MEHHSSLSGTWDAHMSAAATAPSALRGKRVSGMLCRKPLAWFGRVMIRLFDEHNNEVTTEGLLAANEVGQRTLSLFSHACIPRKYTQPQLFACLVLKSFLKADYRGVVAFLNDCPSLRESVGMDPVPHYTPLHKACRRLIRLPLVEEMLIMSLRMHSPRRRRIKLAAIDSTGFESHHCSRYFLRRRSRVQNLWQTTTYTRFPKLGVVGDVSTHLALAIHLARGPTPDVAQMKKPMLKASRVASIMTVLADAGYDSESNHQYCRQELGVRTVIPPLHGRPTSKPAKGRYRRLMQTRFDQQAYGQRWQVETVMSMTKRRQSDSTSGRTLQSTQRHDVDGHDTQRHVTLTMNQTFSTEQACPLSSSLRQTGAKPRAHGAAIVALNHDYCSLDVEA